MYHSEQVLNPLNNNQTQKGSFYSRQDDRLLQQCSTASISKHQTTFPSQDHLVDISISRENTDTNNFGGNEVKKLPKKGSKKDYDNYLLCNMPQ